MTSRPARAKLPTDQGIVPQAGLLRIAKPSAAGSKWMSDDLLKRAASKDKHPLVKGS